MAQLIQQINPRAGPQTKDDDETSVKSPVDVTSGAEPEAEQMDED